MSARNTLSRRRMMLGMGGAAALLPWWLRAANVRAEITTPPKRLVLFIVANGTIGDNFWPRSSTLTDSPILAPLAGLESKLLLFRGIDQRSTNKDPVPPDHMPDYVNLLSGVQSLQGERIAGCSDEVDARCFRWTNPGISLDQFLGDRLSGATPYRTLHLGVRGHQGYVPVSFRPPFEVEWAENDPFVVFERLFSRFTMSTEEYQRTLARKTSILDFVREDVTSMARRMGSEHREMFCGHLEAIREVERTLTAPATCDVPMIGERFDPDAEENIVRTADAQRQLLSMALRCDLTRIVVFQYCTGHEYWPELGLTWMPKDWHGYVHDVGDRDGVQTRISTWLAGQYAALLRELDSVPEGDGTLLDHTAVVWAHEQAETHTHRRTDMPYALAGSCGGFFRTGQFVDLRRSDGSARAHNDLLVTLAHAMGVEIDSFGDPMFNEGPLTELLA